MVKAVVFSQLLFCANNFYEPGHIACGIAACVALLYILNYCCWG